LRVSQRELLDMLLQTDAHSRHGIEVVLPAH
jgi:hypothetical protein